MCGTIKKYKFPPAVPAVKKGVGKGVSNRRTQVEPRVAIQAGGGQGQGEMQAGTYHEDN